MATVPEVMFPGLDTSNAGYDPSQDSGWDKWRRGFAQAMIGTGQPGAIVLGSLFGAGRTPGDMKLEAQRPASLAAYRQQIQQQQDLQTKEAQAKLREDQLRGDAINQGIYGKERADQVSQDQASAEQMAAGGEFNDVAQRNPRAFIGSTPVQQGAPLQIGLRPDETLSSLPSGGQPTFNPLKNAPPIKLPLGEKLVDAMTHETLADNPKPFDLSRAYGKREPSGVATDIDYFVSKGLTADQAFNRVLQLRGHNPESPKFAALKTMLTGQVAKLRASYDPDEQETIKGEIDDTLGKLQETVDKPERAATATAPAVRSATAPNSIATPPIPGAGNGPAVAPTAPARPAPVVQPQAASILPNLAGLVNPQRSSNAPSSAMSMQDDARDPNKLLAQAAELRKTDLLSKDAYALEYKAFQIEQEQAKKMEALKQTQLTDDQGQRYKDLRLQGKSSEEALAIVQSSGQ